MDPVNYTKIYETCESRNNMINSPDNLTFNSNYENYKRNARYFGRFANKFPFTFSCNNNNCNNK